MTSVNRRFQGVWIPSQLWLNRELSLTEKVMLVEISSLQSEDKGCYASNAHFAEFFNLSISRTSEIISSLQKKGHIRIVQNRQGVKVVERQLWVVETTDTSSVNAMNPFGKGDEGSSEKAKVSNTGFNNTFNKDNTHKVGLVGEIKTEEILTAWNEMAKEKNFKGARGIPDKIIRSIKSNYSVYLKACHKDGTPVDDRKSLTDFTCAYLKNGFYSCTTAFHSGENPNKWRADLEYATRKSTFEKIFFNEE